MTAEKFCSINNGFYNTKAIYRGQKFIFKSAIRESIFEYDSDIMTINGTDYVVGEGNQDIELDKTNNVTQLACIMNVLNRFNLQAINIVSAMPVNSYINKKARDEYKQLILSISGVKGCTVYLEGMAAVLADYSWYRGKLICLVDIGGLTVNIMLVDDGKLVADTAFNLQMGTIILEANMRKALECASLCNVPTCQLKYLKDDPIVQAAVKEYVSGIKQAIKQAGYPSDVAFRFTGGGSVQYKNLLLDYFKNAYVADNAIWENVLGLDVVGSMLYKGKEG